MYRHSNEYIDQQNNALAISPSAHTPTVLSTSDANALKTTIETNTSIANKTHNVDSHMHQHITGFALVGGAAELRIDQKVISKMETSMDGRYQFMDVDSCLSNLYDSVVEVAIYEHPTAQHPIAIKSINLRHNSEILMFV